MMVRVKNSCSTSMNILYICSVSLFFLFLFLHVRLKWLRTNGRLLHFYILDIHEKLSHGQFLICRSREWQLILSSQCFWVSKQVLNGSLSYTLDTTILPFSPSNKCRSRHKTSSSFTHLICIVPIVLILCFLNSGRILWFSRFLLWKLKTRKPFVTLFCSESIEMSGTVNM